MHKKVYNQIFLQLFSLHFKLICLLLYHEKTNDHYGTSYHGCGFLHQHNNYRNYNN